MELFGLVDCNNFYCSCERVFHPDLMGKPVVVLSNNDGCVIARSEESKALGIKMGEPFYQVKDKLEQNDVAVFSSNYNLYGDMSRRVMSLLSRYSPKVDVYSMPIFGPHTASPFTRPISGFSAIRLCGLGE